MRVRSGYVSPRLAFIASMHSILFSTILEYRIIKFYTVDIKLLLASTTVTGAWPDWKTPSSMMSIVLSARVRGLQ